jgi:MoxR-like ATPase
MSKDTTEIRTVGPSARPRWFGSAEEIGALLRGVGYLAGQHACGVLDLADRLGKPVLVEGPAGTGKTELAKSTAAMTGARLIRLQCYEGLDEGKALYEWNYSKQLLRILADHVGVARGPGAGPILRQASSPKTFCCPGRCWRRSGRPSRWSC